MAWLLDTHALLWALFDPTGAGPGTARMAYSPVLDCIAKWQQIAA